MASFPLNFLPFLFNLSDEQTDGRLPCQWARPVRLLKYSRLKNLFTLKSRDQRNCLLINIYV